MFALLFGTVSLLYATVGQAGGTAFLALMAFASFPSNEMRPTALLLNIVAATYSTWLFNRGSLVDWAKLRPLLLASLPTALAGGSIVLDERFYKAVTGLVLLLAATILALRRVHTEEPDRPTPFWGAISIGAAVGFVSGLTGVGGGVFLVPILIALHWASPRQTAAFSAPFILANSVVGLAGAMYAGQTPTANTWLFALAVLGGAMIGTIVGLRWLSQTMTRYVLAIIFICSRGSINIFLTPDTFEGPTTCVSRTCKNLHRHRSQP
jgi:uncharacterized membrane protein YfcA